MFHHAIACSQHKATHITIICQKCKNTKIIACKPGLGGAQIPRYCDGGAENEFGQNNECGQDSYVILPHKSKFSDLQTLKLQVFHMTSILLQQRSSRGTPTSFCFPLS